MRRDLVKEMGTKRRHRKAAPYDYKGNERHATAKGNKPQAAVKVPTACVETFYGRLVLYKKLDRE